MPLRGRLNRSARLGSMSKPIFAMCGVRKLNAFGLVRAEVHGKRGELTSKNKKVRQRVVRRTRPDFDTSQPRSFGWSKAGKGRHLDLRTAYAAHCAERGGVRPWGKSPKALHLLVMVSSEWPKAAGDPYSRENERVAALVDQATAWAEEQLGGVFAVRYDCDERSAGIVDVFCAPVRTPGGNRKRDFIMTNRALSELQKRTGERKSYSAVQTSWAAHAQATLDPELRRGEPKDETGAEHVHADTIRAAHEAVELQQQGQEYMIRDAEQALRNRRDALREHEERQAERLRQRAQELDDREAQLKEQAQALAARQVEVEKREGLARRALRAAQELRRNCRTVLEWCVALIPWKHSEEVREFASSNLGMEISPQPQDAPAAALPPLQEVAAGSSTGSLEP